MKMGVFALALLSCGGSPPPVAKKVPLKTPKVASYAVDVSNGGGTLHVHMDLGAGSPARFELDEGAQHFATELSVTSSRGAKTNGRWEGTTFVASACESGCAIDYKFDLVSAANAIDDPGTAAKRGGTFLAPPSTWLLHPEDAPAGARFELAVHTPADVMFASGCTEVHGVYQGAWEDLSEPPYTALGTMRRLDIPIGKRVVHVAIVGPHPDIGDEGIGRWVSAAGKNLAGFYGDYPRTEPLVIVLVNPGLGIGHGSALGNSGASIMVEVGQATEEEVFVRDWILTHEMFHLALPSLGRNHHWAEEGMATYLEPIARARQGIVPVKKVWREWLESMAQGLPQADDHGLDDTHTWGRTYWGGALFWFLADVEIRKRTDNRVGLPDVFRAIYAEGDIATRWPMQRVLTLADKTTATDVLSTLYAAHAHAAVKTDLDGIFVSLGVQIVNGEVKLDDAAPLAAVRRAIVVPPQ